MQNYDGTNYGKVWHWAGSADGPVGGQSHMGPLASPNADTASQQGYNLANGGADVAGGAGGPAGGAGGMSPQKRTFISPTIEGDQRHLFGQGRPMAKDSSGPGSAWATGTVSRYTGASGYNVESRLMFEGTVAATDMSRATDSREKDRIGIFGTGLSYAGSYGRITSESIGRDLNPLGRGAGQALVGGLFETGYISPSTSGFELPTGMGASVNNGCGSENGNLIVNPIGVTANAGNCSTSSNGSGSTTSPGSSTSNGDDCGINSQNWKTWNACRSRHEAVYLHALHYEYEETVRKSKSLGELVALCYFNAGFIGGCAWSAAAGCYKQTATVEGIGAIYNFSKWLACRQSCKWRHDADPHFDYLGCIWECNEEFWERHYDLITFKGVRALGDCAREVCSALSRIGNKRIDNEYGLNLCLHTNTFRSNILKCPNARICCPKCSSPVDCYALHPMRWLQDLADFWDYLWSGGCVGIVDFASKWLP